MLVFVAALPLVLDKVVPCVRLCAHQMLHRTLYYPSPLRLASALSKDAQSEMTSSNQQRCWAHPLVVSQD